VHQYSLALRRLHGKIAEVAGNQERCKERHRFDIDELATAADWHNPVVLRTHFGWDVAAVVARIVALHP
jgi:hypothetical protein